MAPNRTLVDILLGTTPLMHSRGMEDFSSLRLANTETTYDHGDDHHLMELGKYDNTSEKNWMASMHWRDNFQNNVGNRAMDDETPENFVSALTVKAEDPCRATYRDGKEVDYDGSAPIIDVAIHFVPGADKAEANRLENANLSAEAPLPQSPRWLTYTAGNMLVELHVQPDLTIIQDDQTPKILAKRSANKNGERAKADAKRNVVTIDSSHVRLINEYSERKPVDLECTCIEIDAISLYELMTNFRVLIKREGQYSTTAPEENTVRKLETIIEDARRLFIRSPILQRVQPRLVIQKSANTRYGVNTGKMFHTQTTSRAIAELIRQGVSYYSSLSSSGVARSKVKGRFMQAVIFLVSLLNDKDLAGLKDPLEKSYDIKADRQSIELTILKVLPLESVGPYTFLTGVLSAFYGQRVEVRDEDANKASAWDEFLGEIAKSGWLLPGPRPSRPVLGRSGASWKLKWKQRDNSDIFDHLQYSGERGTVNFIPPLKLHSESITSQEVSVEFRNGEIYRLSAKDLDSITLGTSGTYAVFHTDTGEKSDIVVKQWPIFNQIDDVSELLKAMCIEANAYSNIRTAEQAKKSRLVKLTKPKKFPFFVVQDPQGFRTTGVTTIVSHQTQREDDISVAWMLNGRKTTFQDLVRGLTADYNFLHSLYKNLRKFADENAADISQYLKRDLPFRELDQVQRLLDDIEKKRRKLQAPRKPDEPITRVHFQTALVETKAADWFEYRQIYPPANNNPIAPSNSELQVSAQKYKIQKKPIWNESEGAFKLELSGGLGLSIWPIFDPQETTVLDPVRFVQTFPTAPILLLGAVVAILRQVGSAYKVMGFLKITGVDRTQEEYSYFDDGEDEEQVEEGDFILV